MLIASRPSEHVVALHFGVRPEHLLEIAAFDFGTGALHFDGDSWEEWGEIPALGQAVHVVVHATMPEALEIIEALAVSGNPEPFTGRYPANPAGIDFVISDAEDWSEAFLLIESRPEGWEASPDAGDFVKHAWRIAVAGQRTELSLAEWRARWNAEPEEENA